MVLIPLPKIRIYVQPELQSDHQHLRQRGQTQAVFSPPDDAGLLGDVDRQRTAGEGTLRPREHGATVGLKAGGDCQSARFQGRTDGDDLGVWYEAHVRVPQHLHL